MEPTADGRLTDEQTTLAGLGPRPVRVLVGAGAVAVAVACLLGLAVLGDGAYLLHSYLVSYCFWLSISLGALFFVALQHVTRAGWSVAVRRLAELLAGNMTLLVLLSLPFLLPVLLGDASLYTWNDAETVAGDEILQQKTPYLNLPFFGIRAVAYFLVWGLLARFYLLRSTEQDVSGDPALTTQMERFSPLALLLFAVTVTFASFDWLMSLEPHWFSTIFGVYYFSGAIVGGVAAIILAAIALQASGRLTSSVTTEHYHDLGKLLFAFVIFWGYIAFSQYMLIWYANIPEETSWYLPRQSGGWMWLVLALLFGHLLIPFLGMLPRAIKRREITLGFWAVWLLVFHWLDLYWLVMPSYWNHATVEPAAGGMALRLVLDVTLAVGMGALYVAGLVRVARSHALVPVRDPRLEESLAFENV